MTRCQVHRLIVITVDVEDEDIEPGQTVHQAAEEIARDIPEADWTVVDSWVEP